jgi:hypothetical protein
MGGIKRALATRREISLLTILVGGRLLKPFQFLFLPFKLVLGFLLIFSSLDFLSTFFGLLTWAYEILPVLFDLVF